MQFCYLRAIRPLFAQNLPLMPLNICEGLGAHVKENYGDCSSQCPGARKGPGAQIKACPTQLFCREWYAYQSFHSSQVVSLILANNSCRISTTRP